MSARSKIEWTETTWNVVTGCDRLSPGCDNCYALTLAKRLKAMGSAKYQTDGSPVTSGPGFGLALHADVLTTPLSWRQPRRVFVNSMSDLFHQAVPNDFIARVFAVMALTRRHTFQLLTKRHARLRTLGRPEFRQAVARHVTDLIGSRGWQRWQLDLGGQRLAGDSGLGDGWTVTPGPDGNLWSPPWPLPNVWLGVSVETQQWADIRIPALLDTPAAVRWLSCEPLLGPVNLWEYLYPPASCGWMGCGGHHPGIDWVVAGGESGPAARPMHPDWPRAIRDHCTEAKVPFFFKQHGEWWPIGPLYEQADDQGEADDARFDAVGWEVEMRKQVVQLESTGHIADGHQPTCPRTWLMVRRGKKAAGRQLDGRTWDDYPARAVA